MPYVIQATICNQKYYAEIDSSSDTVLSWQGLIENATEFSTFEQAEKCRLKCYYSQRVKSEVKSKQELLKLKSRI